MAFYAPVNNFSRRSQRMFPSLQQDLAAPFFRMFDEIDNASRTAIRSYQPRFDVREDKDAFHLHGELPGVDQKDVTIEFVDPTTLVIRGRTVKELKNGSQQVSPENSDQAISIQDVGTTETQSEQAETRHEDSTDSGPTSHYSQPSVEEDADESGTSSSNAPTPATDATELTKPTDTTTNQTNRKAVGKPDHKARSHYWISERTVGQFHRSFNFPGQIDQDAVTASLKNGILSIIVPKQQPKQPRKISIQ